MANKRGILGQKIGMTQIWDEQNRAVPVTVIQAGPCRVVQVKTPERDGYSAIQLAFGDVKPRRINKPETGHFKKANQAPAKHLAEMRVDDSSAFTIGQVIQADLFASGEMVDVTGISKGHGFSGHIKRHIRGASAIAAQLFTRQMGGGRLVGASGLEPLTPTV